MLETEYTSAFLVMLLLLSVAIIITEVVISRYKLVPMSLRAMWVLSIIDTVFKILVYSLSIPHSELFYVKLIIIVLPCTILLVAFLASAIPFGIDQIITGSNDNISAFIQWIVWACFLVYFALKSRHHFI